MSFPILGDVIPWARQRSFDEWNNAQVNAAIYPVRQKFTPTDDPPGTGVLRLTEDGSNVPAVLGRLPPPPLLARLEVLTMLLASMALRMSLRSTLNQDCNATRQFLAQAWTLCPKLKA